MTHQATHSLARFFLESDANTSSTRPRSGSRIAASRGADAGSACVLREGRITIDRYLDVGGQYANAVAAGRLWHKTNYTRSSRGRTAKGTLPEHEKIAVAGARQGQAAHAYRTAPTENPATPERGP